MVPAWYRVTQRRRETHDTVTLALLPDDTDSTPVADVPAPYVPAPYVPAPYVPGQFNMLYAFGVGEAPISISADYRAGRPVWHTVRAVGAVSEALCRA